jgi:competence protein ComEA
MLRRTYVCFLLIFMAVIVADTTPTMAGQEEAVAPQEASVQASTEKATAPSGKINICTASPAELEKLPGVGVRIAEEIVQYREKNGPFKSTEDLKKVKGIGDKKFEAMKEKITVQ